MKGNVNISVIETDTLRDIIREVLREELKGLTANQKHGQVEYKDTDRLSKSQVAKYLGVSEKTISNYSKDRKIPAPEYNLSGKPRWVVGQLKDALNNSGIKRRFLVG